MELQSYLSTAPTTLFTRYPGVVDDIKKTLADDQTLGENFVAKELKTLNK